jgi:hypothetical protein
MMLQQPTFVIDEAKFLMANANLLTRMSQVGVFASYDSILDILFIEIGETREAITDPYADNMMIRIDPETLEVVGYEIHDFISDFLPANRLFREIMQGWNISRNRDSERVLLKPQSLDDFLTSIFTKGVVSLPS